MKQRVAFVELISDYNMFKYFKLPNIGIIYLATILKNNGYQTRVFSEQYKKIFNSKTKKIYKPLLDYDIIGMNITTASAIKTYKLAKIIKKIKPAVKIIIGGCHATFMPEEALKYCDQVVKGEAEEIIMDLIEGKIKNKIIEGKPVKDLDKLPIPDYNLVEGMDSFMAKFNLFPISTSRGCPFDCNFCSATKMFGAKYRFRSPDKVFEEINAQYKRGVKQFFFYDDNFAANKERTKEFLRKILRSRIKIRWGGQARANIAKDKELMDLIKKTNCHFILLGFESINQESLDSMNKNQNVEEIYTCIKEFQKRNIWIHGAFIFGSDNDSKSIIKDTVEFCEKYNIDSAQFVALTPLPGSKMFSELKPERFISKNWSFYDVMHIVLKPINISPEKLQIKLINAWKRFYSFKRAAKYLIKRAFKNKTFRIRNVWDIVSLVVILKITIKGFEKKNKQFYRFLRKFS